MLDLMPIGPGHTSRPRHYSTG